MNIPIEVMRRVETLPLSEQQEVLAYVEQRTSGTVRGVSGASLLKFSGTLDKEDALEMMAIIEEGCEQVDESKW